MSLQVFYCSESMLARYFIWALPTPDSQELLSKEEGYFPSNM
jgi:hypothetical protein